MTDFVWTDPPDTRRRPGTKPLWPDRIARLAERPGEWAVVLTGNRSNMTSGATSAARRHPEWFEGVEYVGGKLDAATKAAAGCPDDHTHGLWMRKLAD